MANLVKHTALGEKVIKLFDEYNTRMSTPSEDRNENIMRIRMLKNIADTACPTTLLDNQTATDVARIVFEKLQQGWGKLYTENTIFRMGDSLKGTQNDLNKMQLFITAFTQMIDCVASKSKICFDDEKISSVLKNPNMAIAMIRIKDNINKRFGFID